MSTLINVLLIIVAGLIFGGIPILNIIYGFICGYLYRYKDIFGHVCTRGKSFRTYKKTLTISTAILIVLTLIISILYMIIGQPQESLFTLIIRTIGIILFYFASVILSVAFFAVGDAISTTHDHQNRP